MAHLQCCEQVGLNGDGIPYILSYTADCNTRELEPFLGVSQVPSLALRCRFESLLSIPRLNHVMYCKCQMSSFPGLLEPHVRVTKMNSSWVYTLLSTLILLSYWRSFYEVVFACFVASEKSMEPSCHFGVAQAASTPVPLRGMGAGWDTMQSRTSLYTVCARTSPVHV